MDDDGAPCDYTEEEEHEIVQEQQIMSDKINQQAVQMTQLQSDLADIKQLLMSNRGPPPIHGSLATTTTSTTTQSQTVTTQSVTSPIPSLAPASGSASARGAGIGLGGHTFLNENLDMISEANDLIARNEKTIENNANLGQYTGMNMKDLQRDQSISDEVQRQMSLLISGNPALQKVVAGHGTTQLGQGITQPGQGTAQLGQLTMRQDQSKVQHPTPSFSQGKPDDNHVAFQAILAGSNTTGSAAARRVDQPPNLLDMDSLLGITVREKQYRPHEFAARGNFYYAKNINEKNITLPLYVFGYLKHCVILQSGLVPVAEGELMARLVNLMNICEIASNNSTLNDFDHMAWQMARSYGDRVFNDMEHGLRTWSDLPAHVLPDVFLHARDLVDVQTKRRQEKGDVRGRGKGRGGVGSRSTAPGKQNSRPGEGEKMVCTSYNDFYTGNGCAYEYNNTKKCSYEHYCCKCFAANGTKEGHKGRFCTGTTQTPTTTSG